MAGAGSRTRKDGSPSAKVGSIEVLRPRMIGPAIPMRRQVQAMATAASSAERFAKTPAARAAAMGLRERAESAGRARAAFLEARRASKAAKATPPTPKAPRASRLVEIKQGQFAPAVKLTPGAHAKLMGPGVGSDKLMRGLSDALAHQAMAGKNRVAFNVADGATTHHVTARLVGRGTKTPQIAIGVTRSETRAPRAPAAPQPVPAPRPPREARHTFDQIEKLQDRALGRRERFSRLAAREATKFDRAQDKVHALEASAKERQRLGPEKHAARLAKLRAEAFDHRNRLDKLIERRDAVRHEQDRLGRLKRTARDTVVDEGGRLTTKARMEAEHAALARETAARAAKAEQGAKDAAFLQARAARFGIGYKYENGVHHVEGRWDTRTTTSGAEAKGIVRSAIRRRIDQQRTAKARDAEAAKAKAAEHKAAADKAAAATALASRRAEAARTGHVVVHVNGAEPKTVKVLETHGPVTVHRALGGKGFTVTHAASGLAMGGSHATQAAASEFAKRAASPAVAKHLDAAAAGDRRAQSLVKRGMGLGVKADHAFDDHEAFAKSSLAKTHRLSINSYRSAADAAKKAHGSPVIAVGTSHGRRFYTLEKPIKPYYLHGKAPEAA